MQPILISYPLELVHLDFLTLGGKADDNRSVKILIFTDHFTKYAQAYIMPKQNGFSGCSDFMGKFSGTLWWPEKILTDQGKSFDNSLIRELCKLAQIKKLCTSPYHPEANGQCEYFNATLINMLGTLPTHAKKKLAGMGCYIDTCL